MINDDFLNSILHKPLNIGGEEVTIKRHNAPEYPTIHGRYFFSKDDQWLISLYIIKPNKLYEARTYILGKRFMLKFSSTTLTNSIIK